jgi:hypothetical protein
MLAIKSETRNYKMAKAKLNATDKCIEAGIKAGHDDAVAHMNKLPHKLAPNSYKGKKFHFYNNAVMVGWNMAYCGEALPF